MALPPPITALPIHTRADGFYAGFNHFVAVGSKVLIGLLIIWAAIFPEHGAALSALNNWLLAHFGHWYMYVVFFYIVVCVSWRYGRPPAAFTSANQEKNRNSRDFRGFR